MSTNILRQTESRVIVAIAALDAWLDEHPAAWLAALVAIIAAGVALTGMDDCGDRVRQLGGM